MFGHKRFRNESEINRFYSEHLDSLIKSGLDFDETGLRAEWAAAVATFHAQKV